MEYSNSDRVKREEDLSLEKKDLTTEYKKQAVIHIGYLGIAR